MTDGKTDKQPARSAGGLRWAQKLARHADPSTTASYDESDADEVTDVYDEVMG